MRRLSFLVALAGFTFLASMSAFAEADPPGKKAVAEQVEEDDADVPPFARGLIDKEDYLKARSGYIGKLRGLPYDPVQNPRVKAIRQMETQERMLNLLSPNIVAGTWESVGPAPLPNGQTEGTVTPVSGRTISIAVHPTDPNIVYVGTAQGGVYRSTDGGLNWKPIFDSALSLAAGALAISPSSPSTLFVGTGEPNFSCDSFFGVGVYRITNADTTPVLSGPFNLDESAVDVMSGRSIGRIAVHPTDPNVIFVATTTGIGGVGCEEGVNLPSRGLYRSTNALGVAPTFKKLNVATANGGNRSVTDVVLEPGNPNVALCSVVGLSGRGGRRRLPLDQRARRGPRLHAAAGDRNGRRDHSKRADHQQSRLHRDGLRGRRRDGGRVRRPGHAPALQRRRRHLDRSAGLGQWLLRRAVLLRHRRGRRPEQRPERSPRRQRDGRVLAPDRPFDQRRDGLHQRRHRRPRRQPRRRLRALQPLDRLHGHGRRRLQVDQRRGRLDERERRGLQRDAVPEPRPASDRP